MGKDITTEINFFSHTPDGGVLWSEITHPQDVLVPVSVAIYDLRDNETSVDLGKNSFEVGKYQGQTSCDFDSQDNVQAYYDEINNILKKRLDASRVIVFNHIMRIRGNLRSGEEEAELVLQKRFQIINVWRPIGSNAIINNLLTICDYQIFDLNNDLHHADVRRSMVTKSSYLVSYNPRNAQK
ncbi:unnamed protein product [Adineta ricciae]|uniref:Uncharacterized protein n=1 Tax=Adineta ricciae TaxID=249248 RepID=A0A813X9Y4_ADIRI|nr:unnamed protein product [Adineta ricciae]CAF1251270.1 unnamed protein product [Adineta ricciae]